MGVFRKNPDGGIMDVIRCDESSYLVWKWHPTGSTSGASARENAIRWGSSLRVKTGEVALFVYHSNGSQVQDYIVGPFDSILKTENLPLITSAIGLAYNGNTPFQAEVYFFNTAGILQVKIGVPYFDVADPRYPDRGVPVAVRGVMNFNVSDYQEFIKKFQLRTMSLEEFKGIIKAAATKYVKAAVTNAPKEYDIPVTQLETKIIDINNIIEDYLKKRLFDEFGVNVTSVDISDIEVDKTSANFKFLIKKTDVKHNIDSATQITDYVADATDKVAGVALKAAAQIAEIKAKLAKTGSSTTIKKNSPKKDERKSK